MQNKINLQDNFLTRARRGKLNVTVFLMNGYGGLRTCGDR